MLLQGKGGREHKDSLFCGDLFRRLRMTTGLQSGKTSVQALYTAVLELPPSCLEFSPKHHDYFVIGTYNLVKEETNASDDVPVKSPGGISLADIADGAKTTVEQTKKPQTRNGSVVLYKIANTQL